MDRKDSEIRKDSEATARAVSQDTAEPLPREVEASENAPRTGGLLRQGEDLFSLGMYQQAIHVWTRILFLDRGNKEARDAIERAKRALAERQRTLDVEVALASDLLEKGDVEGASERVRRVLSVDPRHREAHQLSERIAALSRRGEPRPEEKTPEPVARAQPSLPKRGLLLRVSRSRARQRHTPSPSPLKMAGFVLGAVLLFSSGALFLLLNWESIVSDGAFQTSPIATEDAEPAPALTPAISELHYYNGARLFKKGRYREALDELQRVERDSAVWGEARGLVLRIEERLLRGAAEPESN